MEPPRMRPIDEARPLRNEELVDVRMEWRGGNLRGDDVVEDPNAEGGLEYTTNGGGDHVGDG